MGFLCKEIPGGGGGYNFFLDSLFNKNLTLPFFGGETELGGRGGGKGIYVLTFSSRANLRRAMEQIISEYCVCEAFTY